MADIVLKKEKVTLSLQIKQLMEFVANDKTEVVKLKLEFWKTCIYHHELDGFPIFKDYWCRKSTFSLLPFKFATGTLVTKD